MKLESTTIGDGWDIIEYTDYSEEKSYFSRHNCQNPGNRPWMAVRQTVCYQCEVAVPDHIQALMTLITWNEKNETYTDTTR